MGGTQYKKWVDKENLMLIIEKSNFVTYVQNFIQRASLKADFVYKGS